MNKTDLSALMSAIYTGTDSDDEAINIISDFAVNRKLAAEGKLDFYDKCKRFYYTCDPYIFDWYLSGVGVEQIKECLADSFGYAMAKDSIQEVIDRELDKCHQEAINHDKRLDLKKERAYNQATNESQIEMFEE